jgi:hypothetical protein
MSLDDKTSTGVGFPDHRQARVFVHLDRCFCQNLDLKAAELKSVQIGVVRNELAVP